MPVKSARWIRKEPSTNKEQWIKLSTGCYLVIAKAPEKSKRFVGIAKINGKKYTVPLGIFDKDISEPEEVIGKWIEMKNWGKENKCNPKKFYERHTLMKSEMTVKEVFEKFIEWKSGHIKTAKTTYKNRLNQILLKLPEGMMIDEFEGREGTQLIKERVCDVSIAKGNNYTAQKHRKLFNQVFDYAEREQILHHEKLPYRLDKPFPFEKNIKHKSHPHLPLHEFKDEFIPTLNANPCNASRLTDLSTKALLMMLHRVSAVVSLQWNWFDDKKNCWVIPPDATGCKRDFGNDSTPHYIPNTPQLETLMNNLSAINSHQKYVFFSNRKGNYPYVSPQTPNDYLKNLGFAGRQDAHGLRHVATTALIDIGYEREMVARCLGHLKNDGAIGHYDFSLRLDKRKEIHEKWNQLLIDEGLRI